MAPRKTGTQSPHQQPQTQSRVMPPRRNLTYEEKLMIIEKKDREASWTQENLALWAMDTFNLNTKPTQATISNILRGRDKLQTTYVPSGYRSARPVKHPDLDLAVLTWVLDMAESNERLTRDVVQLRAAAIAKEMGLATSISFSKGWMSSFMKRHQLNLHKRHSRHGGGGDAIDVNFAAIRQRLAQPAVVRAEAPEAAAATNDRATASPAPAPASSAASSSGAAQQQQQQQHVDGTTSNTVAATTTATATATKRKRNSGLAIRTVAQQQQAPPPAPQQPQQLPKRVVEPQQQQTQQLQRQQSPPLAVVVPAAAMPQSPVVVPVAAPPPPSQLQLPTPPPKKPRTNRLSIEGTPDKQQQQQQLFDLECQKLQIDLEAKQVQLVVEKTLARKKLLDAGIPEAEVNKLFPM